MTPAIARRAGPLFGVLLLVVGMTVAITPVVPGAAALDPTPTADAGATAAASESPAPAPDPSAAPDPTPDPTVAPDPSVSPDPTATPGPTVAPTIDPVVDPSADPSAVPSPSLDPSPSASPVAAGGLTIDHFWVDTENRAGDVPNPSDADTATDLQRFTVYRVRFQVVNSGDSAVEVTPRLLAGEGAHPVAWLAVPEVDPVDGHPFYAAADKGATWQVRHGTIGADRLRLATSSDPAATPVDGLASAGENPAPAITLPAHSFTEIQFAIRATTAARYEADYALRLGFVGADVLARVDVPASMGTQPAPIPDGPAASGKPFDEPPTAFRLDPNVVVNAQLAVATVQPDSGFALAAGGFFSPHEMLNTLASDTCAACHSSHAAQADTLLQQPSPMSTMCFTCHDGTGATANVRSQFTGATANDPATDSWYQHPATADSAHLSDQDTQEFAGVRNRHAACADCHQPHLSDGTKTSVTASGWVASGAIAGASGVAVTNGAKDTLPIFAWQRTSDLEYQLCFKCHSGYTTLTGWNATNPSWSELDKAVEFNPANDSYHPVEAAGENQSAKMAGSLSGTSSLRLWSGLTPQSVIRCANCHASSAAVAPTDNATLDNHASANRGILIRSYQDRLLLNGNLTYSAARFALCFACHSTTPFGDPSGGTTLNTNFAAHGLHTAGSASGTVIPSGSIATELNIDVDGKGVGNSTCAECHFSQHGSSFPANSTAGEGNQQPEVGLVNFAPNVKPFNGVISYVRNANGTSNCTLVCHGKTHNNMPSIVIP